MKVYIGWAIENVHFRVTISTALSRHVLEDSGFLCPKAVVLKDKINGTVCKGPNTIAGWGNMRQKACSCRLAFMRKIAIPRSQQ
jgi:hypothetical protein